MDIVSGLAPAQWAAVITGGVCFGMSKTGLSGISVIAVPLFAAVFGAKGSTGVVLPLLCFADLFAVLYYRRHAAWKYIVRLVSWAIAGFALALAADRFITSDKGFKILIGVCIFAGLLVMFWTDWAAPRLLKCQAASGTDGPVSKSAWYTALFGIAGGFSTMIGNSAGPIMSIFLLSVKLPKESFVGTAAWFFLIVNYLKIPLQAFLWHNISPATLAFDLRLIPAVLLGIWLGILFVKKVSNAQYRIAVYVLTIASTVLLFF
jgi:uncharacterized membrane protein YfcA